MPRLNEIAILSNYYYSFCVNQIVFLWFLLIVFFIEFDWIFFFFIFFPAAFFGSQTDGKSLFSDLISFFFQVLSFLNSILLLNQLNQVVVIATGYNSCDYIFDSSVSTSRGLENGRMPALCSNLLQKLEEFVVRDEQLRTEGSENGLASSLLSGSLSMALCCILFY